MQIHVDLPILGKRTISTTLKLLEGLFLPTSMLQENSLKCCRVLLRKVVIP